MKLTAIKDFNWAHAGVRVEEFAKGAVIETDDPDLIEVATREGWAKAPSKPVAVKAVVAAPENKAEGTAPENKSAQAPVEADPARAVDETGAGTGADGTA